MTLPPLIHRRTLQASWGVSSEAIRQMLASKRLPPLDVDVGAKVQGWYPETLRAAGINVPDLPAPAAASPHTPAAS